jgi:hypothetical protein
MQGQNGSTPPSAPRPSVREEALTHDTTELLAAIARLSDDAHRSLRDQVGRSPYGSLGLAFLGGYVLGGGLTFRVGTYVLAAAGRAMLANLVTGSAPIRSS